MTEKPFFLFQKRLSKLGRSCGTHQILSKVLRSIAGRIPHLCQGIDLKPDIIGSLVNANANYQQTVASGAIAITNGADYGNTAKAGNTRPNWTFYASRSNNKYGKSSTIQPLSFQTLMIVKV